jgi:hypothetical protein
VFYSNLDVPRTSKCSALGCPQAFHRKNHSTTILKIHLRFFRLIGRDSAGWAAARKVKKIKIWGELNLLFFFPFRPLWFTVLSG